MKRMVDAASTGYRSQALELRSSSAAGVTDFASRLACVDLALPCRSPKEYVSLNLHAAMNIICTAEYDIANRRSVQTSQKTQRCSLLEVAIRIKASRNHNHS